LLHNLLNKILKIGIPAQKKNKQTKKPPKNAAEKYIGISISFSEDAAAEI
jgi:hypothetical protein